MSLASALQNPLILAYVEIIAALACYLVNYSCSLAFFVVEVFAFNLVVLPVVVFIWFPSLILLGFHRTPFMHLEEISPTSISLRFI